MSGPSRWPDTDSWKPFYCPACGRFLGRISTTACCGAPVQSVNWCRACGSWSLITHAEPDIVIPRKPKSPGKQSP